MALDGKGDPIIPKVEYTQNFVRYVSAPEGVPEMI